MLQSNKKLKTLIVSLWDTFWSSGIANPITAIEQISYLLFIKRLDELDIEGKNKPNYKPFFSGTYVPFSKIPEKPKNKPRPASELKWSNFRKITSLEVRSEHFRFNVFPFVKNIRGTTSVFAKSMSDAVFLLTEPSLLEEAFNKIEDIYKEIEIDAKTGGYAFQDIQGDMFEMLLGELSQAGKNGQFRTPRHIINLMADLVEPKLTDRIVDPACGTSGFLLGAYQYIVTDIVRVKSPSNILKDEDGFERSANSTFLTSNQKELLEKNICGFDLDPSMVRLGLMNLMMHGFSDPKIEKKDTLSRTFLGNEKFNVVLANPPFTGKLDVINISSDLNISTRSTELLFLSRISKMLAPNGKAAVIVPEGVLFGGSKAQKDTRRILLEENCLEAVISLPSGVFKPYTGVKTSILIFTKPEDKPKSWATKNVWFCEVESDGYSLDDNRRKLKENPLPQIKSLYANRVSQKYNNRQTQFFVELDEIVKNELDLSYNTYKEHIFSEQKFESPKAILSKLIEVESDIMNGLNELREII